MPSAMGIPMQGGDSQMLNQPPPTPAQPMAPSDGMQGTMTGLGGPLPVPAGMIPPEILTGIMQRLTQLDQDLDTFTQITPDQGPVLLQIKELLKEYMGALLVAGSQPASPTAAGPSFAGGGIDRGGMAS